MTDTIESLRAELAEVRAERDAAIKRAFKLEQERGVTGSSMVSQWVPCPVCGEPDMRRHGDDDAPLIECVNHACRSNGGESDVASGLQSIVSGRADLTAARARIAKLEAAAARREERVRALEEGLRLCEVELSFIVDFMKRGGGLYEKARDEARALLADKERGR